ncbi:unnamed protein product, partial [Mycena citricolor]
MSTADFLRSALYAGIPGSVASVRHRHTQACAHIPESRGCDVLRFTRLSDSAAQRADPSDNLAVTAYTCR